MGRGIGKIEVGKVEIWIGEMGWGIGSAYWPGSERYDNDRDQF